MKIGFIGFGNMAKAIASGLIKENKVQKEDVFFSTRTQESRKRTQKEWGITGVETNQIVIDKAPIIFLAVKPHQVKEVLAPLTLTPDTFILSVVAGVTSETLSEYIPPTQFVRVMPNLNAQVKASMTALVENVAISSEKMALAKHLLTSVGEVLVIPENELSIFIALAGSSPALVFLFIDTLARAAVKYGMPKDKATQIAAQAVVGSGKTVLESDDSPWSLIDQVSSPGGITVEAILSLLQSDFSDALIQAVDKMVDKDQDMSNK